MIDSQVRKIVGAILVNDDYNKWNISALIEKINEFV
jgi:hypothetical protein